MSKNVSIRRTDYHVPCESCRVDPRTLKDDGLYIVQFYKNGAMNGGRSLCRNCLNELYSELKAFMEDNHE